MADTVIFLVARWSLENPHNSRSLGKYWRNQALSLRLATCCASTNVGLNRSENSESLNRVTRLICSINCNCCRAARSSFGFHRSNHRSTLIGFGLESLWLQILSPKVPDCGSPTSCRAARRKGSNVEVSARKHLLWSPANRTGEPSTSSES